MDYKEWLGRRPIYTKKIEVVLDGKFAAVSAESLHGDVTTLHTSDQYGLGTPEDQVALGIEIASGLNVPLALKEAQPAVEENVVFTC